MNDRDLNKKKEIGIVLQQWVRWWWLYDAQYIAVIY